MEQTLVSKRTLWGTLGVLAMIGLGAPAIDILNDWVGDWGTPFWIGCGFFVPFLAGVVWGAKGYSTPGRVAGAVVGAAVVLVPAFIYVLVSDPDLAETRLPLLWALFTPLAMAQGALGLPVGASTRAWADSR